MNRKLGKYPSVLTENKFDKNGMVDPKWKPWEKDDKGTHTIYLPGIGEIEVKDQKLVPAYVASELGFNEPGKYFLKEFFYPQLVNCGVLPLCPFAACNEYLDEKVFDEELSVKENKAIWNKFGNLIGQVNYETLMPQAKFLIAILDGSHHCDDGVSAEIGHFETEYKSKPIIGIRSDFRLAENPAAPINCAIRYFIDGWGSFAGQFFDGPKAYEKALPAIKALADTLREANSS
jgi:hypothetical protein